MLVTGSVSGLSASCLAVVEDGWHLCSKSRIGEIHTVDEFKVSTRSTSRTVDLKIYYAEGLGPRI